MKRIAGNLVDTYFQEPQGYEGHLLPGVGKGGFLKFSLKDKLGVGKSREF